MSSDLLLNNKLVNYFTESTEDTLDIDFKTFIENAISIGSIYDCDENHKYCNLLNKNEKDLELYREELYAKYEASIDPFVSPIIPDVSTSIMYDLLEKQVSRMKNEMIDTDEYRIMNQCLKEKLYCSFVFVPSVNNNSDVISNILNILGSVSRMAPNNQLHAIDIIIDVFADNKFHYIPSRDSGINLFSIDSTKDGSYNRCTIVNQYTEAESVYHSNFLTLLLVVANMTSNNINMIYRLLKGYLLYSIMSVLNCNNLYVYDEWISSHQSNFTNCSEISYIYFLLKNDIRETYTLCDTRGIVYKPYMTYNIPDFKKYIKLNECMNSIYSTLESIFHKIYNVQPNDVVFSYE
jgi:hypothetical protein